MCLKCFNFNSNLGLDDNGKKFALSGSALHYTPDKIVQVQHIFLDLEFDLEKKFFGGLAALSLSVIEPEIKTLYIDAVDLDISKVKDGNIDLKFEIEPAKILVYLDRTYKSDEELKLEIFYSKENSNRGIFFVQPSSNQPDKGYQAWSQGETENAKYWFPCLDYASQLCTSEIRAKAKGEYKVISNGLEIENKIEGDYQISHWKIDKPHPSYLMAIAIGEFEEILDPNNVGGIPLSYYAQKSKIDMVMTSSGKTPQMMAFLQEKFNYKYPWGKYAQVWVDDFRFGGMENTSCTFLADDVMADEKVKLEFQYAETVAVHELAHHWFGDLIVAKHWSHAWVKEGAVSYFEAVWWAHEYGVEEGDYYRLSDSRAYFGEDSSHYRRPVVTNFYRNSGELYDRHLYDKGAMMYRLIHSKLGDDLFWKSVSTFIHDNAHKPVETVDLIRAIEKSTGKNLQPLFDQYIFRGGYPDYKVNFAWDGNSKLAKISVTQTQAKDDEDHQNLFDLEIPIALGYVNQDNVEFKDFKFRLYQKDHTFYIPLESKPAFISFDQGNNTIKKVTLEYGLPELKNQIKYDPNAISRIFAAEAIAKKGGVEALKIMQEALKNEKFWGVKVEIIGFLSEFKLDQVKDVLLENLNDHDPRVKRAVIAALADFKSKDVYDLIKPFAADYEQSYFVQSTALRVLGAIASSKLAVGTDKADLIDLYAKILAGPSSWRELVRSGAVLGLASLHTKESLELLIKYTTPDTPEVLRMVSVRSLGPISKYQEKAEINQIVQILNQIATEDNFYMEMAVCMAAASLETTAIIPTLEHIKSHSSDEHNLRLAEETIPKVLKNVGSDKSIQEVKEELDKVKKVNQDLKSRLELLEAKK